MADRTHYHDTPTPAMSAETVPSEEFVPVPREPTHKMKEAGARENQGMYPIAIYRAMIDAAPASNLSPAAKGGDAVREAVEEARSLLKVEYYDDGRIAAVGHDSDGLRKMVALLDAALSTPTEGPASQTGPDVEPGQGSWAKRRAQMEASQTEGMGGDAVREAFRAGWKVNAVGTDVHPQEYLDGCEEVDWEDYAARAALTPPEAAEAVPVAEQLEDIAQRCRKAVADRIGLQVVLDTTKAELADAKRERDEALKALETARAATASDPAPATDDRERLVEAEAVFRKIREYAENIAFSAGVGESEIAGQIVSFLVDRPELLRDFMAGALSAIDTGMLDHHNGVLSYWGMDGEVHRPDPRKARFPACRAALATEASR